MSDDKKLRGPSDRSRIGVSEDRLRELVRQHGNSPQKICEALGKAA